jgi:8-oxo-dGTP pyrophosphatase MutT (NUDIX family)
MAREISSGGVVVRRLRGRWWFAAIRPQGRGESTWALPKGIVDAGESPAATAVREAAEETGLEVELEAKLGDVKYVYTRRGSGERVFKVVSFYLLRYRRGRIGELPPGMALEVAEARWLPLEDGPRLLSYGGEREMVGKALEILG